MNTPLNRVHILHHLVGKPEAAAKKQGHQSATAKLPSLPDFWGPVWVVKLPGFNLKSIEVTRNNTWNAYNEYCTNIPFDRAFDYRSIRDHMIYVNSRVEHELFEKMGLQVSAEAQAAFFSIFSSVE